jgi:hypothetical protein|tara:strand:- start:1957 stop:2544 length:588 start_codon:yes stop_codon:yes gene_type:complete
MASPVIEIRDTGRNSARTGDVRDLADNVVSSWTSTTTGTIAVTDDTHTDVSFTQPADTILRNLIAIPAGNIVTAGGSGNDVDFSLGTSSGGAQLVATEAILDDGGSAVTWTANAPLYLIQDSHGHAANQFVSTSTTAGVVGGPATSEAIAIAATLYSASARTLYARLTPIGADLATAATTVTFLVEFLHLGVLPD